MKKSLVLVGLVMVMLMASYIYAFSGSGSGNSTDPYQITNCTNLQEVENSPSDYYQVINDIDCSDTINWNAGTGFNPIGRDWDTDFNGSFNGAGHAISGLFINRPAEDSVSLFGYLDGGTIYGIRLVNVNFTGDSHAAGLVASMSTGTIDRCAVSGSVEVVGTMNTVGGLVSLKYGGLVNNSYTFANVIGGDYVSGFTCQIGGTIVNDYAVGLVIGSGTPVSGFDSCSGGSDPDDFWDIYTTGQNWSTGGLGKTTAEMKNQSTFLAWDFSTIWQMCPDEYPTLQIFGNCSSPCFPDWTCSGYGECQLDDFEYCNMTIDNNMCNESYTGNYSEFMPNVCDYCISDWFCSGYGLCLNLSQDCNVTGDNNLCGESYTGNYSEFMPQSCGLNCTPNWSCASYGNCVHNLQSCQGASDGNNCNESYTGNYSEFPVLNCGSDAAKVAAWTLLIILFCLIVPAWRAMK